MTKSTPPRSAINFGWRRRLPIILQSESIECGLGCMAMVASFHGQSCDLATIRRQFPTSINGTTLARLIEIGNALGLQARPLRLEPESIAHLSTPCILHWDMEHYVVLWRVDRHGVIIHDPLRGRRRVSSVELAKRFTGVALELQPGANFAKSIPTPSVRILALTGRLVGLKRSVIQIGVLALTLEVFALVTPVFVQMVTDRVLPSGDIELLKLLGAGFLLLVFLQTVIGAVRSWSVMRLGAGFNYGWTSNVFSHLLRLPQEFFERRQLGDVTNRFNSIQDIQKTLTTRFVEGILDGLMAALTLGMMLWYSTTLGIISAVTFLLYAIIRVGSSGRLREAQHEHLTSMALQQSHFLEVVRGIQAVRLHNKAPVQAARYANKTVDAINRGVVVQRLNILFGTVSFLIFNSQRVVILWVGASLALNGELSAGMLIAFLAFNLQFTTRASALIDYSIELRMLRLHGERLSDIVLADVEKNVEPGAVAVPLDYGVRLKGVSFRYDPDQPWLLSNCDLSVRSGESVAITGPSGCGKTTIVRLLLGLVDQQSGSILLGEMDIRSLGKRQLRDMVGVVMQDDHLFTGSIGENISFFDENATQQSIETAARAALIHDDIAALPMGYFTHIGEMGSSLSGGQRQRIVLARALFKQPRILVLDEATSHLDVQREHLVNASIKNLDITRIVIAHRPETIASADRVLRLSGGRLLEVGLEVGGSSVASDMSLPDSVEV